MMLNFFVRKIWSETVVQSRGRMLLCTEIFGSVKQYPEASRALRAHSFRCGDKFLSEDFMAAQRNYLDWVSGPNPTCFSVKPRSHSSCAYLGACLSRIPPAYFSLSITVGEQTLKLAWSKITVQSTNNDKYLVQTNPRPLSV